MMSKVYSTMPIARRTYRLTLSDKDAKLHLLDNEWISPRRRVISLVECNSTKKKQNILIDELDIIMYWELLDNIVISYWLYEQHQHYGRTGSPPSWLRVRCGIRNCAASIVLFLIENNHYSTFVYYFICYFDNYQ